MQILVIEDDEKLAKSLTEGLQAEGYTVTRTSTGEEGFYLASQNPFDVVLLDIMLPVRSGLEILSSLRRSRVSTPVLVLTAKDQVKDRVQGLDAGADDYLVKPFAFAELVARVRALARRGESRRDGAVAVRGPRTGRTGPRSAAVWHDNFTDGAGI